MNPIKLCAAIGACLLLAFSVRAEPAPSPDGQYSIAAGQGIDVLNAAGQPVLALAAHLNGSKKIDVAWSADSRRVVVVTNAMRGSAVLAAWHDGNVWHRSLDVTPFPGLDSLRADNGRLVEEHRTPGPWVSEDTLQVNGFMRFQNGHATGYVYDLRFTDGPATMDRGGYEEGAVQGTGYQLEAAP